MIDNVVAAFGIITGIAISLAPIAEISQLKKPGRTIYHNNPIPSVLLCSDNLGWILYSFVIRDNCIFWSSLTGFMFAIYYAVILYGLWCAELDLRRSNPKTAQGELAKICAWRMKGIIMVWMITASIELTGAFIALNVGDAETSQRIMGATMVSVHFMFLCWPCSLISASLKIKDASAVNLLLVSTILADCIIWTIYGVLSRDPYQILPNVVGIVLYTFQIAIKFYYPSKKADQPPPMFAPDLITTFKTIDEIDEPDQSMKDTSRLISQPATLVTAVASPTPKPAAAGNTSTTNK